jgi:hypothetical protein
MSEWLLLNSNSAFFQLYHGEEKIIIKIYQTTRLVKPNKKKVKIISKWYFQYIENIDTPKNTDNTGAMYI